MGKKSTEFPHFPIYLRKNNIYISFRLPKRKKKRLQNFRFEVFQTTNAHWKPNKGKRSSSSLKLQGSSSSPRSISIVQLNALLHLHPRPIKLVVYKWPYLLKAMGYLILRCSSHLDAFSVYNIRTRLLSYALGSTTDAPEVRPTRSSRTKVSSSQISNAHDR